MFRQGNSCHNDTLLVFIDRSMVADLNYQFYPFTENYYGKEIWCIHINTYFVLFPEFLLFCNCPLVDDQYKYRYFGMVIWYKISIGIVHFVQR